MQRLSSEALEKQRIDTGYYDGVGNTISKLSMSIPVWMVPLVKQRAEALDLTVSQYIRRLVNEDTKSG